MRPVEHLPPDHQLKGLHRLHISDMIKILLELLVEEKEKFQQFLHHPNVGGVVWKLKESLTKAQSGQTPHRPQSRENAVMSSVQISQLEGKKEPQLHTPQQNTVCSQCSKAMNHGRVVDRAADAAQLPQASMGSSQSMGPEQDLITNFQGIVNQYIRWWQAS